MSAALSRHPLSSSSRDDRRVFGAMSSAAIVAEAIAAGRVMNGVRKFVSHIGKQAIAVPAGVTISHAPPEKGSGMRSPCTLTVSGPRGSTSLPVERFVKFEYPQPDRLMVTVNDPSRRKQREMWGLTRTLVANAITGMTEGFTVPIHLVGVGFRAAVESNPQGRYPGAVRLQMKLGYSHSVFVPVPQHIKVDCPFPTRIMASCDDKQKLGQFCADVRRWRKPEPYKGKVSRLPVYLFHPYSIPGRVRWRRGCPNKERQEEVVHILFLCFASHVASNTRIHAGAITQDTTLHSIKVTRNKLLQLRRRVRGRSGGRRQGYSSCSYMSSSYPKSSSLPSPASTRIVMLVSSW